MVFRPELSWEKMSADEIAARSVRAVRNHVKHLKETSAWYREALGGLDPSAIAAPQDIAALPLTDKETLVKNLEKFWAVKPAEIAETVVTSGANGAPVVFFMTRGDIDRLAFNEALSFHGAGVGPGDRAQILVSLDRLFIAGMAYYRGLVELGVNTARIGVVPLQMHKHFFSMLKPTVIVGVPSFLLKMGKELNENGFNCRNSSIGKIFCIGETIRGQDMKLNGVGGALEELYGASVYSTYGCTELSAAYCECTERTGNHAHPELVYTEIVDEEGGLVEDGEVGELVATPLGVEGTPLLRYRTGDITFKIPGTCACGRNSARIGPILARKSQMIKLKGATLYPATIIAALDELDCIQDYIVLLEGSESLSDQVTLHVVSHPRNVLKISEHLRSRARVSFPVLITNTATINAHRGDARKKIKIIDKRTKTAGVKA